MELFPALFAYSTYGGLGKIFLAFLFFFQVDPRCSIWYLRWYHEPEIGGERHLKSSRNANDPYVHTIHKLGHHDFGKYTCVIENVVGKSECSAHLVMRSKASMSAPCLILILIVTLSLALPKF